MAALRGARADLHRAAGAVMASRYLVVAKPARAGWCERADAVNGAAAGFAFARYAETIASWEQGDLLARLADIHGILDTVDVLDRGDDGSRGGRLRDECCALRAELHVRGTMDRSMWRV